MLALFVLRPYGGTTTFALENAWPRCSLFWSFDCGYTALAWAGYASAYRGFASAGSWINHNNVNSGACIGGASVPWTIARQTAGREGLHWPSRLA